MDSLQASLLEKAANANGWECDAVPCDGGLIFSSSRHTVKAFVCETEEPRGYRVTLPDVSAILSEELNRELASSVPLLGYFAQGYAELGELLRKIAAMAMALPDNPEQVYQKAACEAVAGLLEADLAMRTEVERTIRARIGQDLFRKAQMDYWGASCAVTAINRPEVLRASHARPWADCESDAQRLDVFNGFLLNANLDALFDKGLISFDPKDGSIILSKLLTKKDQEALQLYGTLRLRWVSERHVPYLAWHQERVFRR